MKKEILKLVNKNASYNLDKNYNWCVRDNLFTIYDKKFNFNESFSLKEKQVKKVMDIMSDEVSIEIDNSLILRDKDNKIVVKEYTINEVIHVPKIDDEKTFLLNKDKLEFSENLLKSIKTHGESLIKDYVCFVKDYIFKTDTYQLGYYKTDDVLQDNIGLHDSVIKLLIALKEDDIKINYSNENIEIVTDNYVIITKNYRDIPDLISLIKYKENIYSHFKELRFNKKDLVEVLKTCDKVAVDSTDSKHSVYLRNKDDNTLYFVSKNNSMEIEKEIVMLDKVEDVLTGFNITFLLAFIDKHIDKNTNIVSVNYLNEKTMLCCESKGYNYIFMPVVIK